MKRVLVYIHWMLYLWYIYIFGYAGIFKIINVESMITGMDAFGFNLFWTHVIGWAETLGLLGLLLGFGNLSSRTFPYFGCFLLQ
jgi:hypothetical protein